ncbi:MAG: methyltransferase domain-containing protein [Desulfobacteraceae bacterium]|jgi:predicted TPR repeat methyltransferase
MNVFEAVADYYDRYRKPRPSIISHIVNTIKRNSLESGNILDLGCGTGGYATEIGRVFDKIIYGVDSSDAMVLYANKKGNVQTSKCDCNEFANLPNTFFTFAYCVNFLHYINNLDHFFSSVYKTLDNHGVIYVATHTEEDILRQTLGYYFPSSINVELSMIHPVEAIIRNLSKNGFSDIEVEKISRKIPLGTEDFLAYKFKTYNCLHSIDEKSFDRGLVHMESDIKKGTGMGLMSYTVVKGGKHD